MLWLKMAIIFLCLMTPPLMQLENNYKFIFGKLFTKKIRQWWLSWVIVVCLICLFVFRWLRGGSNEDYLRFMLIALVIMIITMFEFVFPFRLMTSEIHKMNEIKVHNQMMLLIAGMNSEDKDLLAVYLKIGLFVRIKLSDDILSLIVKDGLDDYNKAKGLFEKLQQGLVAAVGTGYGDYVDNVLLKYFSG